MICEFCDKAIDDNDTEVVYREDGEYHENCYHKWAEQEEAYWAKQFSGVARVDESLAYEPNDPKNPAYVDWALSAGDQLRDEQRELR